MTEWVLMNVILKRLVYLYSKKSQKFINRQQREIVSPEYSKTRLC